MHYSCITASLKTEYSPCQVSLRGSTIPTNFFNLNHDVSKKIMHLLLNQYGMIELKISKKKIIYQTRSATHLGNVLWFIYEMKKIQTNSTDPPGRNTHPQAERYSARGHYSIFRPSRLRIFHLVGIVFGPGRILFRPSRILACPGERFFSSGRIRRSSVVGPSGWLIRPGRLPTPPGRITFAGADYYFFARAVYNAVRAD